MDYCCVTGSPLNGDVSFLCMPERVERTYAVTATSTT